ncbi:hypothetical protein AB6D16_019005 [Vibrio cyclitrophicus]
MENDKGQGCLFVLDECHLLFPLSGRGTHTDSAEADILSFLVIGIGVLILFS